MSKQKDSEAERGVLDYLNKQNRPYSATDVFSNLHKEFGKTLVQKSLELLAEKGLIKEKTYGKQKVYVADQSQYEDMPDTMLKEMDTRIVHLNERLRAVSTANSQLDSELSSLNKSITTEEVKKNLSELHSQIESSKSRLSSLKQNNNSVSPVERQRIMVTRSKYVKEWRRRRRMTNDILSAILEGYPKSKKELYEDIGIETDDDYKVTPPDL